MTRARRIPPLSPSYVPMVKEAIVGALPHRIVLAPGQFTHDGNAYVIGALNVWFQGDADEGRKRLELAYAALHTEPSARRSAQVAAPTGEYKPLVAKASRSKLPPCSLRPGEPPKLINRYVLGAALRYAVGDLQGGMTHLDAALRALKGNPCVTCDGSGLAPETVNLITTMKPCYSCKRAGRI